MTQRQTQTEHYWVESFQIKQTDIDHLYSVLLEREVPLTLDEMALILVRHRIESDAGRPAAQPALGNSYAPTTHYEVGDEITFPLIGDRTGKVIATRLGINPLYDSFTVVTVEFEDKSCADFASNLPIEESDETDTFSRDDEPGNLHSPEELFIEYGGIVAGALEMRLSEQEDIVRIAGRWFPRSLLAEVNAGHLNLAEAVLDMMDGGPLAPTEILKQIETLEGVNERLAEFSFNYALQQDSRFDEVGPAGQVLWFLHRMEPPEVRTPPDRIAYTPIPYDLGALTTDLHEIETEIGDEHSQIPTRRMPRPQSVTVLLTYPHQRAGTLPLSPQLKMMFPTAYEAPRIRFTLVDAETNTEFPGWVVRPGGYVYGLKDWFKTHQVPVGGYLTIQRTDEPGRVSVRYALRKPRVEWVRTAIVDSTRLRFENRKMSIGCEYDDLMIIHVEDDDAVDSLWQTFAERRVLLDSIVLDLVRELSNLNPQGHVHARTLYSAVNLIRRCPPGPIFALLSELDSIEHVGGPYWRVRSASTQS